MTIEELEIQNRYLVSEVERLNNNIDYLDKKLDEELDKSAMLSGELMRLRAAATKALQGNL
jgi:predicted RNase H-like nuclease (RuvC/YqgF family)